MSAPQSNAHELFRSVLRERGLESVWLARSEPMEMLLDVCSLPRVFDEALVESVLLPLTLDWLRHAKHGGSEHEDPTTVSLLTHGEVETVPGSEGLFRVRSAPRDERLAEWARALERRGTQRSGVRGESTRQGRGALLVRASREIALACAARGPAWELEQLYQSIAAEPHHAEEALRAAYASADAGFDRVRCYELICLLDERDALLTEGLVRTREDLRRYFESRIMWSDAYAQSAHALEREFMREAFDWVQSPSKEWIGVLEAKGGMGKSMFVRWLIARRCVPEPVRIPCARIDFDFPLPTLLAEYPWMIIPRLVEQLDVQLPSLDQGRGTSELQRLAGQIEEQYRIASQSEGVAQGAGRALSHERSASFGAEAAERFGRALAERATGPVLIVFDTVEEAYLRRELFNSQGQNVLDAVMLLLGAVHAAHPSLKVVFAGRFSPAGPDATADFALRHQGQLRPIRHRPFSNAEATTYLADVRGLAKPGEGATDARIAAIVSRSEGLPLVLALWADIVLSRNSITVKEIEESPEADLAYLVERVLDRLRDGRLHWVIRYGVIPRRLNREFFRAVLMPRMREAMQGRAPHDNPATDSIPGNVERQRFRTNLIRADEELDADVLWQELSLYVSGSSFVSRSAEDAAAMAFHSEVVGPMRRVLRKDQRQTYQALHADAVRFFEAQAQTAPNEGARAAALREAIYHLMQDDSEAVATTFERWVTEASGSSDSLFGKVLVDELLSLQQETGEAFANPLAPVLLLTAHAMRLEALLSDVQRVAPAERANAWVALAKSTDEFRKFREQHHFAAAGSEFLFRLAEATVALNFEGAQEALPRFEGAMDVANTPSQRLSATLGAMDAADRLGLSDRAQAHADTAWRLVQDSGSDEIPLHARMELARVLDALRRTSTIIELLEPVVAADTLAPVSCVSRLVQAYLHAGRVEDAVDCSQRVRERIEREPTSTVDLDERAEIDGLCALALVRHGEEPRALELTEGALQQARQLPRIKMSSSIDPSMPHRASAIASDAVAACSAELLDVARALEMAEMAQQEWAVTGNAEEAGAALAHRAVLAMCEMGDYRLAGSLLDESQRLTLPEASEVRGRLLLLRALHRHFTESGTSGLSELRALPDDVAVRRWRGLRVLVFGALVHLDSERISERLDVLERDLMAMHPVGSRLEIFNQLAQWLYGPLDLPPETHAQLKRIAEAIGVSDASDSTGHAEGHRSLLLRARCALFLDQSERAHVLIEQLLKVVEPGALGVHAIELAARIAQMHPLKQWGPLPSRFRNHERLPAHASGRLNLALAEIALAHESAGLASTMMSMTMSALNVDGISSRWEVRAHLIAAAISSLSPATDASNAAHQKVKPQLDRARQLAHTLGGSERTRERLLSRRMRVSHASPLSTVRASGDAVHAAGSTPKGSSAIRGRPTAGTDPLPEPSSEFVMPTRETTIWTSWRSGLVIGAMDAETTHQTSESDPVAVLAPAADGRVISFALVKRATDDWRGFASELSRATLAQETVRRTAPLWRGGALRLVLDPLSIASLPFELLDAGEGDQLPLQRVSGNRGVYRGTSREPATPVRWAQEAVAETGRFMIVDGVWGPKSTAALKEFQSEVGLPPTGAIDAASIVALAERMTTGRATEPVAMIVGGLAGARRSVRSATFRVKNVFDASALYTSVGFEPLAVSDQFNRELLATRPAVVHLQGSYDEVSSLGGVVMTPRGAPTDLHADEALSPSMFGRTLRSLPRPYRPIVVLDPPRARSRTESVRQLLLRNVFAHELFRLDCAPAVFAAGFEDPDGGHTVRSYQVYADAWRNQRPVLDVLQRLRSDRSRRTRDDRDLVALLLESPALASIAYASTPALSFFVRPGGRPEQRSSRGPA